jgi:CRP-like cAMP-binding protein
MILNKRKELRKLLSIIPIFEGLTDKQYNLIMPLLVPITQPADTIIINQNDDGDCMYIIKSGSVKITRTKEASEILIGTLDKGSFFGELSLIDNLPRSASIITTEETSLFRLNRHDFTKIIEDNQDIALIFYNNCLRETFFRFRGIIAQYTSSQVVLDNKNEVLDKFNEELSVAQKYHSYFISKVLHENYIPGSTLRQNFYFKACSTVGGNYCDIFTLNENKVGIILADANDQGTKAITATSIFKSTTEIISPQLGHDSARFTRYMNRHLIKTTGDITASMTYGILNSEEKTLTCCTAGNTYPLLIDKERGKITEIESVGEILGKDKDNQYHEVAVPIKSGREILFYTTGAFKATGVANKEEFLKIILQHVKDNDLEDFFQRAINNDEKLTDDASIYHLYF